MDSVANAIGGTDNDAPDSADREHAIRMATAVLMTDVARADSEFDESEFNLLLGLIERHFELEPEQANQLANAANEQSEESVSLHRFTKLLHEHLSADEKAHIIALLWRVAYADGRLDKFEDSLVLKISDLLYVNRGRVMRLKHDAEMAAGRANS